MDQMSFWQGFWQTSNASQATFLVHQKYRSPYLQQGRSDAGTSSALCVIQLGCDAPQPDPQTTETGKRYVKGTKKHVEQVCASQSRDGC